MTKPELIVVGWCELITLPAIGISGLPAKIDTGAKTSALHAFGIEAFEQLNERWVRFYIHDENNPHHRPKKCEAPVADERWVRSSSGQEEKRFVVCTDMKLEHRVWPIEVTLTDRDKMRFPMLVGREAMEKKLLVNPAKRWLHGRPEKDTD